MNEPEWLRRVTLLVTNLIKLSGLVLALYEAFSHSQPPALVIGLCAFMMAGAQVSERALLSFWRQLFGSDSQLPPEPPEPPVARKRVTR